MRILMVNTRHFRGGGDSTYTFNLADLLRSKGHTVAFFAMQDERNIADSNSDLFVSHIDFQELNRNKSLVSGLRIIRRVIYSTEARTKFVRLIKRFHPDIIHLQSIHGHITPSIIFEAKKRSLPVVWTLHDYKLICPNTHFLIDTTGDICVCCGRNSYFRATLKRCKKGSLLASSMAAIEAYVHRIMGLRRTVDFFLSPSSFLMREMIARGFPPPKMIYLPLFLPDNMFHIQSHGKDYLLFMGKLESSKGIFPLLSACREVPDVNLVIAGPVREPIANQLPKLLPSNAKYIGMKQPDEIGDILSKSSAVVLPSLSYENQPFCILEAFAAGKPVIASDLGGMRELVRNSKGGLLVPPGDVQALAKSMRWMVTHANEADEMGRTAREYAIKAHGSQNHYEKLMKVYDRVLK